MRYLSKFTKFFGVSLIIVFSLISIMISVVGREFKNNSEFDFFINFATSFESIFYDFRLRKKIAAKNSTILKNPDTLEDFQSKKITLVKIDDETLASIGVYPIPRDNWAKLIDKLGLFGVKVIAFDVFYPEKSKSCSYETSPDTILAESIESFQAKGEHHRVILPYTTSIYKEDALKEFPDALWSYLLDSKSSSDNFQLSESFVNKNNFPIEELINVNPDLAYIMMEEDRDGVFRHYPVAKNLMEGMYFPSLALRSYLSLANNKAQIEINQHHNGDLNIGKTSLYLNHYGETKIRWYGASKFSFPEVSMLDILKADPSDAELKKILKDRVVFIGSTALGAHDFRNTPVDPKTPGVYAHMNMLYMLLNNYVYQDLYESMKYTFYLLGLSMMVLMLVMYFGSPIIDFLVLILLFTGIYAADYFYFLPQGYELRLFFTFLSLALSYSWITGINFSESNKDKKKIKGAFSRYVAPAVVNDMLDHPDKLKVGGERRDITCMFSDVRDFTSISEQLSANQLASALNRYMGEMTDIVFETNGTLDKYIGDAIVAFWGAPLDIGDHVNQAVDAAVKMLDALPAINKEFEERGLPEFKIGLGLNSGECNVGNMGSDQIFAYTALGDNMNLGARLESSCKFYGAQILISEYTYERLDKAKFKTRLIDFVQVKGKTEPVKVYEVLYSYHPLFKLDDELQSFKLGYDYFVKKDFQKAIEYFQKVLKKHPEDKSSLRLTKRCQELINNPPESTEDHTITVRTDK